MAKTYPKLSSILKRLLFERDMKPTDLARKLHMPQPTIHRLVVGKSGRPHRSSLLPIADYFAITVEQLLGDRPLPSENTARGSTQLRNNARAIPWLAWDTLTEDYTQTPQEQLIVTDISARAFATNMPDSSMEPLFPAGTILIFEPELIPKDRSYVLVKLHDANIPLFRQLLVDIDHRYLKPLSPDLNSFKMRLLNKNDRILACLIESRFVHKPEIEILHGG